MTNPTQTPEYMTPRELVAKLGHSVQFWREAMDKRRVTGHRSGRRVHPVTGKVVGERKILVSSAQNYLAGLDGGGAVVARPAETTRDVAIQITAAFRRRRAAQGAQ